MHLVQEIFFPLSPLHLYLCLPSSLLLCLSILILPPQKHTHSLSTHTHIPPCLSLSLSSPLSSPRIYISISLYLSFVSLYHPKIMHTLSPYLTSSFNIWDQCCYVSSWLGWNKKMFKCYSVWCKILFPNMNNAIVKSKRNKSLNTKSSYNVIVRMMLTIIEWNH